MLPGVSIKIEQASKNLVAGIAHLPLSHKIMSLRNSNHPLREEEIFEDSLSHYLSCPKLWNIVFAILPPPDPPPIPLEILCLRFEVSDPRYLLIAHTIYHSLRHAPQWKDNLQRTSWQHFFALQESAYQTGQIFYNTTLR